MQDPFTHYARQGEARNGSPFTNDRAFKRPVSFGRMVARAIRDGLAIIAFLVILWALLSPLAS